MLAWNNDISTYEGKSLCETVDDLWDCILDTQNNFSLLRNISPFFVEDAKYQFYVSS